ncbi:ferredoxin family protein [Paenibacillus sp. GSMTC-2017]|uniref:4Fe-4S dicluster domain-containing protein n=1 Tax=Paenibacillus sp. GSMTC-2017 TaxID=2794350 RepID=UPI0018D72216|nr:ferredoxin family protein [Paenibacillus sp. GSMTC-2017]MBH5317438.1 ferredoxin family protein [Paenibacillus sp. GSMTC-2017]
MIELVSSERCISCNICVKVCPTNVFDKTEYAPVIARQEDCQTCFICEAYCPVDALYVSPYTDEQVDVDEVDLAKQGILGSWRATIGWGTGRARLAAVDTTPFIDRILPLKPIRTTGVSDVKLPTTN